MKTRLLKKIRKRYSITRVDWPDSNNNVFKAAASLYGLPFFILEDKRSEFSIHDMFYKTFEEAYAQLCKTVLEDYAEKFRHVEGKSTKVWWNKK